MADRPERVLQVDQLGIRSFVRFGVELVGIGVEPMLGVRRSSIELIESSGDRRHDVDTTGQREHAGQPA